MESPDDNLELDLGLMSPFQSCQVGVIMSIFLWRRIRSVREAQGTCWEPQQLLPQRRGDLYCFPWFTAVSTGEVRRENPVLLGLSRGLPGRVLGSQSACAAAAPRRLEHVRVPAVA